MGVLLLRGVTGGGGGGVPGVCVGQVTGAPSTPQQVTQVPGRLQAGLAVTLATVYGGQGVNDECGSERDLQV